MIHQADVKWLAGLIAAIVTTLTAQIGVVPAPWARYLTVVGLVCSVIASYRITPGDSEKRP